MHTEPQAHCGGSVLTFGGFLVHVTVHREGARHAVNYQVTNRSGKQENLRGLLTFNLQTLKPQVLIPPALSNLLASGNHSDWGSYRTWQRARDSIAEATIVAWTFAEGIEA